MLAPPWIADKNSPHRHKSLEQLIEEGLVTPFPPAALEFGEHINLELRFNRLVPSVEIEFIRMWDNPEEVALITFRPRAGRQGARSASPATCGWIYPTCSCGRGAGC
jgi:hypothetical protein